MSRRTQFRAPDEEAPDEVAPRNGLVHERTSLLGKSKRKASSAWATTCSFLRLNYCNVLLPIVPVALVFGILDAHPVAIFVLNFLAIIPLASVLSDATEELAEHVGHTLGGLLNASFGNATELIVCPAPFLTASETNRVSR